MKIAIIDEIHAEREKSGIGKYTFELYRNLRKIADTDLLGLTTGVAPGSVRDEGVISIPPGISAPVLKRTLNWQLYYPKNIPPGYDIYHATNPFLIRTVADKKNSVLTVHDMGLFELKGETFRESVSMFAGFSALHRKLLKDNINKIKMIIAVSEYTKEKLIKMLGVERSRIEVVYHGVSPVFGHSDKKECREKLGLNPEEHIILYTGTELPKKNVGVLIRGLALIAKEKSPVRLVRIGTPSSGIKRMINRLNLGRQVSYYENVPEEALPVFYGAADVFVFPSKYEGFGMPLLEAMACGVPVIASRATCFPEILGDAGTTFDPDDEAELAGLIFRVLDDADYRTELIEKGCERVKEFSWENTAVKTLEIYKQIL
ncbi:MAG: glycosyltransferase family 4 protein [Elusimicrobia bacterium]|nr:glycosyltransferase family 4 protein [Elusimicrobiota bacterium]